MRKIKLKISMIRCDEMHSDNYFAHRMIGAVELLKVLIGKQTIEIHQSNDNQNKINVNVVRFEDKFIGEWIDKYNQSLKGIKRKILSHDDDEFGTDFSMYEIAELIKDREQRKIDLNLAFIEILKENRAQRTVTGG